MKRILKGIIPFVIFSVFFSCAEKKSQCRIQEYMNNSGSGEKFFYNNQRLVKDEYYTNGNLNSVYEIIYNVDGNISSVKKYSSADILLQEYIPTYTSNKLSQVETYSDPDMDGIANSFDESYTYSYNSQGFLEVISHYNQSNTLDNVYELEMQSNTLLYITSASQGVEYFVEFDEKPNAFYPIGDFYSIVYSPLGTFSFIDHNIVSYSQYSNGNLDNLITYTYSYREDGFIAADSAYTYNYECIEI